MSEGLKPRTRTVELAAFPRAFETYRVISPFDIDAWTKHEPFVRHGRVCIRRYEVSIKRIEEPVEVLRDRLIYLWRNTEIDDESAALMREAMKDIGMRPDDWLLPQERGIDRTIPNKAPKTD